MRAFAVYGFVPALLWLGFVLAISFMEAPLKFRATGVSRSQALAIGQVVLRALNLVESVFLLAVLAGLPDDSPRVRGMVFFLAGLFAVQQLALRSPLDLHIAKLITEGASPSPSAANLHGAYVLLEVIKAFGVILLIVFQLLDFPPR
jgi:hypothetical protein